MKKFAKTLSMMLCVAMLFGLLAAIPFASAAGDDGIFALSQLSIASEKASTLAPGVTLDSYTVYDKNGDQVKMFVTKVDPAVETVRVYASYRNMDNTNYGMSRLTAQVNTFNQKVAAGDEYYEGTAVAGINSSYYNMITGKPTGTFVMNGIDVTTESEGNSYSFYAILEDGTHMIGARGEYSTYKDQIVEAIGGYHHIVKDGDVYNDGGRWSTTDTKKYPRQTLGVTADGEVILMTADGNQAPKSVGLTLLEQAQVMIDLGCVEAIHLDGGGSCTYACKPEGSNTFAVANSPSDGSEREISNGLIIASTVISDGKFASANLYADNTYVTPNSEVAVSAVGVDAAGGPAVIPTNVSWKLADESFGTVANGVFKSTGKVGEAVVQMVYNDKVVGEITINVVIPDKISFSTPEFVVPYTKSVSLAVTATYGVRDVVVKPSDFNYTFSNPAVGTLDGFTFTACNDSTVTNSTVSASCVYDANLSATSNITLGKGSEVVYDFEDGNAGIVIVDETPNTKYNYVFPETEQFIVGTSNGKVHSGDKALGAFVDYSNSLESGYMKTSLYATETKVFENAVSVGIWLYIPDEWVGLWVRWTLPYVSGYAEDGSPILGGPINGNSIDTTVGGTGVVYSFDEPGWHYLHVDTSAYDAVGWKSGSVLLQFYISDRDGTAFGYTASENSNIPSKYYFYVDDLTVDYSTAVDDREAPVLSNVTYAVEGMPDAAALNGNTVTVNKVTFAASVADYTGKSNFTGINPATVKAYVDGVEVEATYSNGKVSAADVELANGKHIIKFAAEDNMGNYGYVYQTIVVNAAESASTVKLVPADPDANRILLGSIYNMNLVATAIEEVNKVEVIIDLDNNSKWQLDHMTPAAGFEAAYTVDATENIATITVTRTGENTQTGEAALITLPVRVWQLKTGYTYENGTKAGNAAYTMKQFRDMKEFWRMSVIANVDKGVLTRVDGTTDTFTGERVFCDTEMWGNYAKMVSTNEGVTYYNSWNGGHLHTATALEDKPATCTENGYTGRTYCEGCDSVVNWGTTVPAAGHTYAVTEGVVKCACGDLFSGVYTDGKTYVDGVIIADSWVGDSYYKDGVKLTGLNAVDGIYYDFGEDGVCPNKVRLDGFFYDTVEEAYRYFTAGEMAIGEVSIFPEVYFYDENGVAVSGTVSVLGYDCLFDEKGAFVSSTDANVVDAGYCGTNVEYVLLSNGTLKVDGEGVMKDYASSGTYPAWVTQNEATAITALEVGNGITKIGRFGFYKNVYMRSVTFEENSSLKTISWGAFGHNWRLAGNVEIPASVEVLEGYAFYECGALTSVTFEEGSQLKSIGNAAFYRGRTLKSVYIPDTVAKMEADIFHEAYADIVLQVAENSVGHLYAQNYNLAIELRQGVVRPISSGSLSDSVDWTLYSDGVLEISGSGAMPNFASHKDQPWYTTNHLITKIVIGKDITAIGNYAFCYGQKVTEIVFEEGSKLEKVGVLSFHNLPSVKSIVLPETVTSISAYSFGDCFGLEFLYVPQGTVAIYSTAFSGSDKVVLNVADGTYAETFAINNSIEHTVRDFIYTPVASGKLSDSISWARYDNGELWITGSGAMPNFASHKDQPWYTTNHLITKIVIDKDITAIGNYAFCYAQKVTEIVFEEGSKLEKVGVLSFHNLPSVKSVVLPETVTSISAYGFGDCFGLESLYVPQSTVSIYFSAFTGSDKVVLNVAKGAYAETFAINNSIEHIVRDFVYIPVASGKLSDDISWARYDNGELWITGTGAMPNFASHKDQPWYTTNHLITKIVIGKDITAIGNYAFCYAQKVTEIVFEEGSKLEKVGVLSFHNLPSVKSIVLPETVTTISAYSFGDCFGLESIYIPESVTSWPATAFSGSDKVVVERD